MVVTPTNGASADASRLGMICRSAPATSALGLPAAAKLGFVVLKEPTRATSMGRDLVSVIRNPP